MSIYSKVSCLVSIEHLTAQSQFNKTLHVAVQWHACKMLKRVVQSSKVITNFKHINWIPISPALGIRINVTRIFPGLRDGAIVPDVAFVRKNVGSKSDLTLFHILGTIKFVIWKCLTSQHDLTSGLVCKKGWEGGQGGSYNLAQATWLEH